MKYFISDSRGPDYYDDLTVYDTLEAAEVALREALEWAREEAKREPSWRYAWTRLRIESIDQEIDAEAEEREYPHWQPLQSQPRDWAEVVLDSQRDACADCGKTS